MVHENDTYVDGYLIYNEIFDHKEQKDKAFKYVGTYLVVVFPS